MQTAAALVSSRLSCSAGERFLRPAGELLSLRAEGIPLFAVLLLAAGLLWFSAALGLRFLRARRNARKHTTDGGKKRRSASSRGLSFWGWFPAFLCEALGGCLLFLFCEDPLLAAGLLFLTALLYAALLGASARTEPRDTDDGQTEDPASDAGCGAVAPLEADKKAKRFLGR